MTEHNPLFQEIEEDLERQKLEALWKRYGKWVVAGAFGVVLATAAVSSWHSWRVDKEQKTTAALIEVIADQPSDAGKKIAVLESLAKNNPGTAQASLARFHAAGLAVKDGDEKKAIAFYDAVAHDDKAEPEFRQLADLYSVRVQMDTGNPVLLQKRLQPLLAENAPWRFSAMETAAFLALRVGDKARARRLFDELSQNAVVPKDLAKRADDMARYLDE